MGAAKWSPSGVVFESSCKNGFLLAHTPSFGAALHTTQDSHRHRAPATASLFPSSNYLRIDPTTD
jgi:hypothetical protein